MLGRLIVLRKVRTEDWQQTAAWKSSARRTAVVIVGIAVDREQVSVDLGVAAVHALDWAALPRTVLGNVDRSLSPVPRAKSVDGITASRRKWPPNVSEPMADGRWRYGLNNRSVVNRMAAACFETSNVMATSAITVSAAPAAIDVPACKPCSCIARRADWRKNRAGHEQSGHAAIGLHFIPAGCPAYRIPVRTAGWADVAVPATQQSVYRGSSRVGGTGCRHRLKRRIEQISVKERM